jgi:hypothetical protein
VKSFCAAKLAVSQSALGAFHLLGCCILYFPQALESKPYCAVPKGKKKKERKEKPSLSICCIYLTVVAFAISGDGRTKPWEIIQADNIYILVQSASI